MDKQRRQLLKTSLAAGTVASLPAWVLPALAADEELVPFSDMPADYQRGPAQAGAVHFQDTRQINTFYSDNQDFYVVQHYGQPDLNVDQHRLRFTGLVEEKLSLSLAQLKRYPQVEMDLGFECGGNQQRLYHGLVGNARWKGVRLADVLADCKVKADGIEVVFFGADSGEENIRNNTVKQHFARSLSLGDAMDPNNLLAFEMNGEPLPLFHGKPLRLIVPGWYGVANVKWLDRIHVQNTRFMGRFMARDYVTLKKDPDDAQERWVESSVGKMQLKSIVVRVTRNGDQYTITGFALNDGTPLTKAEIKIDDGPWQQAQWHPQNSRFSWKLFSLEIPSPGAGEHRLISRVSDAKGNVQPVLESLPEKATYWEDYAQQVRTIVV